MAVATYGTDLLPMDLAEDIAKWAEMTGRTSGGAVTQDERAYIQGLYCVSQSTGNASGRTVGLQCDYGSSIGWTSGFVFLIWQFWQAPKAIGTWADGGMRFGVGSSAGNVKLWNAQGNDYGRNPYGGWANVAVDPTYIPADETIGTPVAGEYRIFCSAPYLLTAVTRGNPHCVDAIRYGRGILKVEFGEAGNYGTFTGMAVANDADTARWGLFSLQMGNNLWKGLMSLGTDTNPVNFVDSNRSIIVDDCPRTYLAFNRIEIRNAGSVVTWNNISFKALGTLSPGQLEVVTNVPVSMDGCSFQDMDTFIFQSNSSVINSTFKNCKLITSGGGIFTGTKVLTSTVVANASAFGWNSSTNPDGYLDNMTFSKGANAHHAINFGTSSPTTITLRGIKFSGFNASNNQNDSVLYIARTSGTVTVQCIGTTGTVSYKSAGATVNVTQGVVTKVTVKDIDTGNIIVGAMVLVKINSGANYPNCYNTTVSIIGSGTTATVTNIAHGLKTGDYVVTYGVENDDNYNGVHLITVTGANTYTYTTAETITASPATGTIKATLALIRGTTNSIGVISDQRPFTANQPIIGWARMSTSTPLYKQQPISDTVDSSLGKDIVILLIRDE